MAIASRPKPPAHNRKRQARHHRRSKAYAKAYWPYLPMLAVVGGGLLLNRSLDSTNVLTAGLVSGGSLTQSRIEALTGQAVWPLALVLLITAAAAVIFGVSHWYRFRRLVSRGGTFLHHSWFDVFLVAVLTAGFLLAHRA